MSRASRLSGFTTAISGDTDLNVGIVTATQINVDESFTFTDINVTGVATANNLNVTGVSTLSNVVVGGATTELVVTGDARITGILTVGTSSLTLNGDSSTISGITSVNSVSFPSTGPLSNRNIVINGAMQVAQRGTSVAVSASNIVYTLDRFCARPNSNTATTVTQVTDAPTGFQYSARVTRNSGQTGELTRFETPLETKDIIRLRGQKVTISFYAKAGSAYSPTSSVLKVQLFEGNGTERARQITSYDNETTLVNSDKTLTTSWQRFTHTTTVDVASDTTQLALQFYAPWIGTAPSNDEYFITGVQLEVGTQATPFEHRSFGDELQRCQRYYQHFTSGGAGTATAANQSQSAQCGVTFMTQMRTSPTIIIGALSLHTNCQGTIQSFDQNVHGCNIAPSATASGRQYWHIGISTANAEL